MKKTLIFTILTLALTSLVHAEMVSYVDEAGKVHYVDTNYMKVPDRYKHQVQEQLKDIPEKKQASVTVKTSESADNPFENASKRSAEEQVLHNIEQQPILFFVENSCAECMIAESLLGAYGVSYQKYNVKDGDMGQNKSAFLGIKSVPAVAVGEKIVYGADPTAISAALRENGYRLGQGTQKARPEFKQNPFQFKTKK